MMERESLKATEHYFADTGKGAFLIISIHSLYDVYTNYTFSVVIFHCCIFLLSFATLRWIKFYIMNLFRS